VPTADDLPRDELPWERDDWGDDQELARGPGLRGRPLWFRIAAWVTLVGLVAFVLLELRLLFL
jgi:hypothetical protein